MNQTNEELKQLKSLLMRLMKSMGMTSKAVGEMAAFLYTVEEVKWMLGYLIEYQDTTEDEAMRIVGLLREQELWL